MNPRRLELARRHGLLEARIAEQRQQLARHVAPLARTLDKGDEVLRGIDWLKHHPAAVGVVLAGVVAVRPRGAWRWAKRSFVLWRGWQALKAALGTARS